MAEPKPETQAKKAAAEVQAIFDEATEKGYFGETFDPNPNSAYSLASGPDGPPLAEPTVHPDPEPQPKTTKSSSTTS